MNIQPLEIYGEDASFGGGLKLLNRYYDDALITVVRHNDGAPAEVYPDQNGKVSLNSQIAVGMTFSSAINLGQFLNQPGYTEDSEVAGQLVTAGVSKIYDQSPNQNSATNSDTNTQFLICDNGEIFASEYGLQLFTLDKFMTVGSVNQSFSLHLAYTPVEAFSSNQQPIIKQADDQFAFNSQNLLGLILGGNSYPIYKISTVTNQEGAGLVLIDEDYFSNYTGSGITLESETAKILTVESQSTDAAYDSTSNYVIGGANGGFYTCIIYTGNGFKSRRHRTNQIMVENIENLSSQLVKFSPESFYNHFYNASAIFATVSLAGLNSTQPKKLIRVLRSDIGNAVTSGIIPIDSTWAFRADVYADSSGRLSLASPIENVIDNYSEESRESAATNLGEFLNANGYTNVDNLPIQAWGFTDSWYDQSVNEIKATKTRQPIIYNGAEQKFEPAVGDESIVKAMNFDYGGNFQAKFDLDTPIASPKSIIFVYANNGVTDKYSLLGGWSSGGPGYYSRYPKVNDDVQGFSMPDGIAAPITYTQYGLNTSTHIAGISLGDNPQFVVDDNDPIEFDIVPPNEYFDPIEFKNIGPMFGYIQAVIIYDEDKLNDFPEIFSVLQGFFGVEDSSLPETSVFEDIPHVYGDVTHIYSVQELSDLAFNLVRLKVDTTDFEFAINAKSTTGELYEPDIRAFSENNDARLLTLYNQVELSDDNFEANQSADLIKIYEGSTQSMVRLTPPNKVVIDPTASNQRFTKTNSISILDDSCIYLIGKYPSTDCTLIGDGTTKIEVVGSSFVVTTSAGNYSFASGRSVNDFFVFRIDRLGTSLVGQTNNGAIYEHTITSTETFEFNTLLANGANDSTQYTGEFYGVVVFGKSKRDVGQNITATIYAEYGLTLPPPSSQTPMPELLLNTKPGAAAAYSLRLLDNTYTDAAIRVRRASDNVEQNIGFADNVVDVAAIESFCAGTDGYVTSWRDQSGNGNHLAMVSTAMQPQIVSSGSVILENGRPKIQGALGKALDFTSALSGGYKIYSVGRVETNTVFIGSNNTADYLLIGQSGSSSTGMFANASGVSVRKNGSAYTLTNRGTFYTDFGAQHVLSVEATLSFAGTTTRLGYGNNGVFPMMSQQELIIYPSTSTHTDAGIETNINDYYSIYE